MNFVVRVQPPGSRRGVSYGVASLEQGTPPTLAIPGTLGFGFCLTPDARAHLAAAVGAAVRRAELDTTDPARPRIAYELPSPLARIEGVFGAVTCAVQGPEPGRRFALAFAPDQDPFASPGGMDSWVVVQDPERFWAVLPTLGDTRPDAVAALRARGVAVARLPPATFEAEGWRVEPGWLDPCPIRRYDRDARAGCVRWPDALVPSDCGCVVVAAFVADAPYDAFEVCCAGASVSLAAGNVVLDDATARALWPGRDDEGDLHSVALLGAVQLGQCGRAFYDPTRGEMWAATRDDLTPEGQALLALLERHFERPALLLTYVDT